jgi:CRISPR-associated protein Csm3
MTTIKLYGRLILSGTIVAKTGLHIGGSGGSFAIGAVDNSVIKNPLTNEPYIPGSSLRGKMRSLTEKYLGLKLVKHANVRMHTATDEKEYKESAVAKIYGVPAEDFVTAPTRLIVRDVNLTEASRAALRQARTDAPYTEIKTEVSIDRITSNANPRSHERVPAGAEFGEMEMVYSIYGQEDVDLFKTVIEGMALLEDDYLGGSGSRGSGKIQFKGLRLRLKTSASDSNAIGGDYDSVAALTHAVENDALLNFIQDKITWS